MSTLAEQVVDQLKTDMDNVYDAGYQKGKSEGGDSDIIRTLVEDSKVVFDLSKIGITRICDFAFYKKIFENGNVVVSNNMTSVGSSAFQYSNIQSLYLDCGCFNGYTPTNIFRDCTQLSSVEFGENTVGIPYGAFLNCTSLTKIHLPNTIKNLGVYCFEKCINLTTINIPSSLEVVQREIFLSCTALEFVTIENGFNATGLDLSPSTKYSVETIVSWLEALADRTGLTAYTLIIGRANLDKLTEEQKAIATSKNWTLA